LPNHSALKKKKTQITLSLPTAIAAASLSHLKQSFATAVCPITGVVSISLCCADLLLVLLCIQIIKNYD
jgi:hypothetical protein